MSDQENQQLVRHALELQRGQREAEALTRTLASVPTTLTPLPVQRFRLNFMPGGPLILVCAREGAVMADGTVRPDAVAPLAALELTPAALADLHDILTNGLQQLKTLEPEKRGPIGLVTEE